MTIRLTQEQDAALAAIARFLEDDTLDAFVLRGSAGTGKTTLIAKLVERLESRGIACALLAPTGRAARIVGNKIRTATGNTDFSASTIHRAIYRLSTVEVSEEAESANDPGVRMIFPLKREEPSVGLFVVDESSMVGDKEVKGDFVRFGSGRLLRDLVDYARARRPGRDASDHIVKLLFIGDPAQLPPVGEQTSPALSEAYLGGEFGLRVATFDLFTVMRQARGSAILERATELRDALLASRFNAFTLRPFGEDIERIDVNTALDSIAQVGRKQDATVAIVRSNASALDYNRSIRQRLWGDADLPPQPGDTLLVNRNSTLHTLSNGDLVEVVEAAAETERIPVPLRGNHLVELSFRKVRVASRGADGVVFYTDCLILENLLGSRNRELEPLEQRALLVHFRKRHPDLHPKSDEFRMAIQRDEYFNALQVKYGYSMTCHKAQGGEWPTVIVDFSAAGGARNADFFRWAYTAITRASRKLLVINPPDFTAQSEIAWAKPATPGPARPATVDGPHRDDPDWERLAFSDATAPLMPIHRRLRELWEAREIAIAGLQHLQYCERYRLARDGKRTTVQYYYDKRHRLGRFSAVPDALADEALTDDALSILSVVGNGSAVAPVDAFLEEFLTRMDAALAQSEIRRLGHKSLPYRLRVRLSDGRRTGEIDFTYDGAAKWTVAQEVGGAGSTQGLYDAVQRYMTADREAMG